MFLWWFTRAELGPALQNPCKKACTSNHALLFFCSKKVEHHFFSPQSFNTHI